MEKKIHIVCAGPADNIFYGSGSLLFLELESLCAAGASITLHIFGGEHLSEHTRRFCKKVFHYPLQTGHKAISFHLPYHVAARHNTELHARLMSDPDPVIFYGWESTSFLLETPPSKRFYVRLTAVPHKRAREYSHFTRRPLRKLFYLSEVKRAVNYERKMAVHGSFLCFHEKDRHTLPRNSRSQVIPLMIPARECCSKHGLGNYGLYYGDFSDKVQERNAIWLLEEVFAHLPFPFILAGKSPSPKLIRKTHRAPHATIVKNPTEKELHDLIEKSQVIVFPLFSETGIRAEMYQAVIHGRHCIYSGDGYVPHELKELCHRAGDAVHARKLVNSLFNHPFGVEDSFLRNTNLGSLQANSAITAKELLAQLFRS